MLEIKKYYDDGSSGPRSRLRRRLCCHRRRLQCRFCRHGRTRGYGLRFVLHSDGWAGLLARRGRHAGHQDSAAGRAPEHQTARRCDCQPDREPHVVPARAHRSGRTRCCPYERRRHGRDCRESGRRGRRRCGRDCGEGRRRGRRRCYTDCCGRRGACRTGPGKRCFWAFWGTCAAVRALCVGAGGSGCGRQSDACQARRRGQ